MIKELRNKLKINTNILKVIGIFEIIGGITGVGLVVQLFIQGSASTVITHIILSFIFLIYSYSIYAGIMLFRKLEKGLLHSKILQYFQLVSLSLGSLTYYLTSGGYILIGYNITKNDLETVFGIFFSEFQINLGDVSNNDFIYINILALVILYLLDKVQTRIEEIQMTQQNYKNNIENSK
ncbi:MAG: hypothetical protein WBG46_10240 [Nonlabens sp.]